MPRIVGSFTLVIEGEEYKIPRLDFIKFLDAMASRFDLVVPEHDKLAPEFAHFLGKRRWRKIKPLLAELKAARRNEDHKHFDGTKKKVLAHVADTANYLAILYRNIEKIEIDAEINTSIAPKSTFYERGETCEIDCPNCGTGTDLRLERSGYIYGDQGFGRHQNGFCGVCGYKYAINRDIIIKRLWPSENVGKVNGPTDGIHWTPQ